MTKLARALAFLSGITTAISAIKLVGGLAGTVAEFAAIPTIGMGKGPPAAATNGLADALPWAATAAIWLKGFAGNTMLGAIPQIFADTPGATILEQVANQDQYRKDILRMLGLGDPRNAASSVPAPDPGSQFLAMERARQASAGGYGISIDTLP